MHDRKTFLGWWEHFRQMNGITMRIIASIPGEKFDTHPIPNMRTPKELLVHMYGVVVRDIPAGISTGEIKNFDEKPAVDSLKSKDDVIRFCTECWTAGDKAAKAITDANLLGLVKTPWDMDMPGVVAAGIVNDEYLHHRGQLYAYTRALGIEPPAVWDFEHNDAAFAPQATAKA